MQVLSTICLVLALISAVAFALLVLLTGKGDAMSGGGSVRTTYKGKATFDDIMSKATLYLGIAFMGLVLLYNVFSVRATAAQANLGGLVPIDSKASTNEPATNTSALNIPEQPVTNSPATNSPATNAPATNAPVTNEPAANTPK